VRTSDKSIGVIDIYQYFCLAFILAQTYIGAKEQEAVPKMGFRPSGRPFRGVQKASFLESGLVRIPSAKHRKKGFPPRARGSHRFRRTKRRNEPISGLSGKRFSTLPRRSKKT
jgi:hypothetical protein